MICGAAHLAFLTWLVAGYASGGFTREDFVRVSELERQHSVLDAIMWAIEGGAVAEHEPPQATSPNAAAAGRPLRHSTDSPRVPPDRGRGLERMLLASDLQTFEELRGNHEGMVLYADSRSATGMTVG
eukprot:scaffold2927_cov408-Prasinococcus_capsulatus_cf.AAC.4